MNDETFAGDGVESPWRDDSMVPWQRGKAIAAAVPPAVVRDHAFEFGGHGDDVYILCTVYVFAFSSLLASIDASRGFSLARPNIIISEKNTCIVISQINTTIILCFQDMSHWY